MHDQTENTSTVRFVSLNARWLLLALSLLVLISAARAEVLIETHTAAPGVVAVILESPWLPESSTAPLNLARINWKVDGSAPLAISRYTVPYDQPRKSDLDPKQHEAKVRHRIYLDTKRSFISGRIYSISTPYGNTRLVYDEDVTLCEAIKVNQVGYHKNATSRFANFGVFLGDGGSRTFNPLPIYSVKRVSDRTVVLSGTATYIKDDTFHDPNATSGDGYAASGEHVYRLSLNEVPEGGPYYVVVHGCGRSYDFGVGDEYTRHVAYVAARGLYHQRCGIALERRYTEHTRGACHLRVFDTRQPKNDPERTEFIIVKGSEPSFAIAGGHHDAGDFDRREQHYRIPLMLLATYEGWPTHFRDSQYNIPESQNGIPDILDEALWAIRAWEHLQISDPQDRDFGGVRMGTEADRHPGYGVVSAASDTLRYGTYGVHAYSTAWASGLFAHASRLIQTFDASHALALRERAENGWQWLVANANPAACEAKYMYAALQLYLLTGKATYHDTFKSAAERVVIAASCGYPENYNAGNWATRPITSTFASYLTPHGRSTDARIVAGLRSAIKAGADTKHYMGVPTGNEPYFQGYTKFGDWGASTGQGRYAEVYMWAHYLETDPKKRQEYFNNVARYHDYALGLNPLSVSFVTGLGDSQLVSPLHLDSYFSKYGLDDGVSAESHGGSAKGNVPGLLIFGATAGRSGATYQRAVTDKIYPAWENMPRMRRWGDGWSAVDLNEVSLSSMIWNVMMYGFLYDASQDSTAGSPRLPPPAPPILLE